MIEEIPKEIIVYRGVPVQKVTLDKLLAAVPPKAREVTLASDIFTSEYGIVGFLLADYSPEEGRNYWPEGSYGWRGSEEEWEATDGWGEGKDNLRVKCKRIPFPGTFKMVRYFIMPNEVGDFFRSDRYLGEPMIEKIVKENLIPNEWWNPDDWEEHKVPFNSLIDKIAQYREVVESIGGVAKWKYGDVGPGENHRAYQSFHLYQDFMIIRDIAQESVVKALTGFDKILAKFDEREKLREQRKKLNAEQGKEYPTLSLPKD